MATFGSQVMSWLTFGSKIAIGLVVAAAGLLYVHQEKLLYMPYPPNFPRTPKENPPGYNSPADYSIDGYIGGKLSVTPIPFEDHFITTKDGFKVHTWLLLQSNSNIVPTLIYFHGNAGNMGFRLKNAADMYNLVKMNILMVDYRGYGESTGYPSETGLNIDADEVLNYAVKHPRLSGSQIIAFGRSLGGAVAISLAQRFPNLVAAVIVENTFLSVDDMVDHLMPAVAWLKGDSDTLVPPTHMKSLRELATKSHHREFYSVLGGTHNDTWEKEGKRYYKKMKEFVETHVLSLLHGGVVASSATAAAEGVSPPSSSITGSSNTTTTASSVVDGHTVSAAVPFFNNMAAAPGSGIVVSTTIADESNEDLTRSQFSLAGLREHVSSAGDEALADYFIVSGGNSPITVPKEDSAEEKKVMEEEERDRSTAKVAIPTMAGNFSVF